MVRLTEFAPWLTRWHLTPDGEPFETPHVGSKLLPVRQGSTAAMLKLGRSDDEKRGSSVMAWWDGQGAAPVLAHDETALLMARAEGEQSLADIARADDDGATRIICGVVAQLHAPRGRPHLALPPLDHLFAALRKRTEARFAPSKAAADALLAEPRDLVVLHGDIHHANVLDFETLGWRAIDPWGFVGERAYDYTNIFKNPTLEAVTEPGRLERQLSLVADVARLEPQRLLRWVLAHAGLSAAWSLMDGDEPALAVHVMGWAAAELG